MQSKKRTTIRSEKNESRTNYSLRIFTRRYTQTRQEPTHKNNAPTKYEKGNLKKSEKDGPDE